MSVVSVEELWEGRGGSDGIQRKREYKRTFEVLTDDPADDVTVAGGPDAAALGLPRNGDSHPLDEDSVVVGIDGENSGETPLRWVVTVQYSTEVPRDQAQESQTIDPATGDSTPTDTAPGAGGSPAAAQRDSNPLNWSAVYKVSHEQTTEPLTHDRDGDEVVNSAGKPFYPPIEVERSYAVVTVTKNYAVVRFDWLENFQDAVNNEVWNGRAVRTCRILAIEYEPATENNVSFWRVVFRIKIKAPPPWNGGPLDEGQGWDIRVVDQGFQTRVVTDPDDAHGGANPVYAYTDITDPKTGEKPEKPVLLDGAGHLHPAAFAGSATATESPPKFVTVRAYKEKAFSLLGL